MQLLLAVRAARHAIAELCNAHRDMLLACHVANSVGEQAQRPVEDGGLGCSSLVIHTEGLFAISRLKQLASRFKVRRAARTVLPSTTEHLCGVD